MAAVKKEICLRGNVFPVFETLQLHFFTVVEPTLGKIPHTLGMNVGVLEYYYPLSHSKNI